MNESHPSALNSGDVKQLKNLKILSNTRYILYLIFIVLSGFGFYRATIGLKTNDDSLVAVGYFMALIFLLAIFHFHKIFRLHAIIEKILSGNEKK